MERRTPILIYPLAIAAGLLTILAFSDLEPGLYLLEYGLLAAAFGFLWPATSWRWGLWIAAPVLALVGLGLWHDGNIGRMELGMLSALLLAACSGGFVGAWVETRLALRRSTTAAE